MSRRRRPSANTSSFSAAKPMSTSERDRRAARRTRRIESPFSSRQRRQHAGLDARCRRRCSVRIGSSDLRALDVRLVHARRRRCRRTAAPARGRSTTARRCRGRRPRRRCTCVADIEEPDLVAVADVDQVRRPRSRSRRPRGPDSIAEPCVSAVSRSTIVPTNTTCSDRRRRAAGGHRRPAAWTAASGRGDRLGSGGHRQRVPAAPARPTRRDGGGDRRRRRECGRDDRQDRRTRRRSHGCRTATVATGDRRGPTAG